MLMSPLTPSIKIRAMQRRLRHMADGSSFSTNRLKERPMRPSHPANY